MQLSEARGRLILIGGSEDREGDRLILKEFVRLAGGAKSRIVVMTVATDHPEEMAAEYKKAFKALGIDDIAAIDVSAREDTSSEAAMELIEKATGIFFTGGDQLHITALLGGTHMHSLIMERFSKGVVVGGTSAGASMMGNSMIVSGGAEENPKLGGVEIGPGMDFVLGAIIDVHFSQRGRIGRLLTAVAHFPHDIGFGIDEDTAMVMTDNHIEVLGSGAVTIIDAGDITYTNLPYVEKHESLALHNIKIHVLPAGYKFDLSERAPVIEEQESPHYAKTKAVRESKESEEDDSKHKRKPKANRKSAKSARAKG